MGENQVERYYRIVESELKLRKLWERTIKKFPPNAIRQAVSEVLERLEARGIDPDTFDWGTAFAMLYEFPSISAFIEHLEREGWIPPITAEEIENYIRYTIEDLARLREVLKRYPKLWSELRDRIAEVIGLSERVAELMGKARRVEELEAEVRRLRRKVAELTARARREVREYGVAGVPVLRCPSGEEPILLDTILGFLMNDDNDINKLRSYVVEYHDLLFKGLSRPASPESPTAFARARELVEEMFGKRHPSLFNLLWDLAKRGVRVGRLKFYAWCPVTDQIFEIRAGYRRGKYYRELGRAVPDDTVIRAIEREVGRPTAPPTPPGAVGVFRRPTRGPFGIAPHVTFARPEDVYAVLEEGRKCPVCGTDLTGVMPYTGHFMVHMYAGIQCPNCGSAILYFPGIGWKYVSPPTNYMEWWKPEWISKLEELKKKGFRIGHPYSKVKRR